MEKKRKARITALGTYLPAKILTNKDFESMVDTSDEWIVSRTGIKQRHVAAPDEYTSNMGTAAARNALEKGGLSINDMDAIVAATMTPDYTSSSIAALIEHQLDAAKSIAAVDLQAACSGFLYALSIAKAYVESGMYRRILVVASEKMSSYVNYMDRSTSILFGDGAAAAIVADEGEGLLINAITLGADGSLVDLLLIPAGGVRLPASPKTLAQDQHTFKMEGKEVFKHAVRRMSSAAKESLDKAGLAASQISWLVPHQANMRIMEAVAKGFDIPDEKLYKTIQKYGNTSASSVPIALCELMEEHPVQPGQHILTVTFGAGFTWAAGVLTKVGRS